MARIEANGTGLPANPAAYAIPVLAQIAGTFIGNEFFSMCASLAIALAYPRMRWGAGIIVASAAAGLIIAAVFFSTDSATANSAAHAAYWMAGAGVLALAFERMAGRKGSGTGGQK